jgi:hypothetical protein
LLPSSGELHAASARQIDSTIVAEIHRRMTRA